MSMCKVYTWYVDLNTYQYRTDIVHQSTHMIFSKHSTSIHINDLQWPIHDRLCHGNCMVCPDFHCPTNCPKWNELEHPLSSRKVTASIGTTKQYTTQDQMTWNKRSGLQISHFKNQHLHFTVCSLIRFQIWFDSGKTIDIVTRGVELLVAAVFKWEQQDQSTQETLATYVFVLSWLVTE